MKEYELTKKGVADFLGDTLDEILDDGIYNPIKITIGSRTINVTIYPETFELLETMLRESIEIIEEEYNDEIQDN